MKYSALSDTGLKRDKNEDNWNIVLDADGNPGGFIIADGMGGHLAGEEASRIAVEEMSSAVLECVSRKIGIEDLKTLILKHINVINDKILNYAENNLGGLKSGTTLTAGIVLNRQLCIVHVGDSRIYRIRGEKISRLTEDHSYVAALLKGGLISSDQANHHPDRNRITRALGFRDNYLPDIYLENILSGDIFLFCTDGLYEDMEDKEILETVLQEPRETVAKNLVEKAKDQGGSDNITVIVAWM
ncbi:MAG TPA: Stp1/IreP family PP2C-type Ser/Thr phosphatase [Ruminiclostridium sp.]|nr:Stp1/IreP family PP2C-type Ser/Thr phosphatase [Ruminiclostridium sp.]